LPLRVKANLRCGAFSVSSSQLGQRNLKRTGKSTRWTCCALTDSFQAMLFGSHAPGFEPLARALEATLSRKPYGGAALCVYQDGQKVFDMWGGPRDDEGHLWEEHTPSVSFSTTKGVAATALHMLVDRNLVHYDEPVARYWPEFAQNGKQAITVRQVLNHSAGLYDVRGIASFQELLDWDKAVAALARAPAAHEPGQHHGYHVMTHGHLVGELVRRASGKDFSRFVREEIAEPLGLSEFWVGAPDEAIARAARLRHAQARAQKARSARDSQKPRAANGQKRRRSGSWRALERGLNLLGVPADFERLSRAFTPRGVAYYDFSSAEVLRACIPSFNGLFSARDLARMYAALSAGGSIDGTRLMSFETLRQATRVQTTGPDHVLMFPMGWRLGYHGVRTPFGSIRGAFGHFGYGGSGAWASPNEQAAMGFVVNAGAGTPLGDLRVIRLSGVAIQCIRARR
jgi:CubicO group peptidase (beta-lactamase class C family)